MKKKNKKMEKSNVKAMRAALEEVRFYLPYFLQYMRLQREDAEAGGYYEKILEVINAALSDPPRNCDMEEVVRYRCKWCGREFRTPNRHKCRFDPSNRCCLSCKHCGKFDSVEEENLNVPAECIADGVFVQPTITIKGFRCLRDATKDHKVAYEVGEGGYNDFPYAIYGAISDGRGCPNWEIIDGYCGKWTFAEQQRRIDQGGGAE